MKTLATALVGVFALPAAWAAQSADSAPAQAAPACPTEMPFYPYPAPWIAPLPGGERIAAVAEQQRAFADRQARYALQAMEAQRKFIEQTLPVPPLKEPLAGNRLPMEPPAFDRGTEEVQAQREQMRKEMEARRKEAEAQRAARRKEMGEQLPGRDI
ncbi:MAG TPA: hypothetical protein ENK50_03015 [Sedimenticola sp.]|nr:hypothetical protein [Sedimenticola sp.]